MNDIDLDAWVREQSERLGPITPAQADQLSALLEQYGTGQEPPK